MGIQKPTSTQSLSGDIAISKATLSRYGQLSFAPQNQRAILARRMSNNYSFQSNVVSASNAGLRKNIARAAASQKNA